MDRSFERATRKWLETRDANEGESEENKRLKTRDARSQSKQNQASSSSSSVNPPREGGDDATTGARESYANKRTASKVAPNESRDSAGEPDAKRNREGEASGMSDIQHLDVEVDEFYSVVRIAPRTLGKYVKKSMSFDIAHEDKEGKKWDFTLAATRQKARQHVKENKPLFIIGSPPCDQWSKMQNLNTGKRDPDEVHRKLVEARIHLDFCAELYQMQIDGGRYYVHEHPTSATSWNEKSIKRISSHPDNFTTRIHMCAYGMKIPDAHGN